MDDREELLNLLEWAVDHIHARNQATGNYTVAMEPNWTLACQKVAAHKGDPGRVVPPHGSGP